MKSSAQFLLLILTVSLLILQGCTAAGSMETGRVLEAGEREQVLGLGLRFEIPDQVDSTDSWDWPDWSLQQLLLRSRFFHLDAFWMYRLGVGDSWNVEAGVKLSLLATFVRQAHAPGVILGARRGLYDGELRAAAAGIRWSGDVLFLGDHPANLVLLSDLQMRVTASHDYQWGTTYITPAVGHRWAWSRKRDWRPTASLADDAREQPQWAYDRGAALMFSVMGGTMFTGDRLGFAAEGGADFFPSQQEIEGTRMLPRLGVGLLW
jgi:hypothetical protein